MRRLLLSLVLVTGCTYYMRPNQLPPAASKVAPEQRVATWNRALGVLLDEGYVPTTLDANACFISARMRDDVQLGALQGTLAMVMIAPDGRLRVAVSGHGEYTSEDGLLTALTAEQDRITKEILAPAPPVVPAAKPATAPVSKLGAPVSKGAPVSVSKPAAAPAPVAAVLPRDTAQAPVAPR
jgi:hypothetical protein